MSKQQVQLIELEPLMVDAKTACRLCGNISARTWATWISTGRTPPSIKLNGRRLWRYDLLKFWVRENCPTLDKFLILQEAYNESKK